MTTTTKKATNDQAALVLREMGAELLKQEDRMGETKTGWWMDGVYLAPTRDAEVALRVLNGGL